MSVSARVRSARVLATTTCADRLKVKPRMRGENEDERECEGAVRAGFSKYNLRRPLERESSHEG